MSYNIFSCLTVNHSWLSHLTIFDLSFYPSPNPHLLISLEYEPHNHQKKSQKKLPRSKETFTSQFPGLSLVSLNGLLRTTKLLQTRSLPFLPQVHQEELLQTTMHTIPSGMLPERLDQVVLWDFSRFWLRTCMVGQDRSNISWLHSILLF